MGIADLAVRALSFVCGAARAPACAPWRERWGWCAPSWLRTRRPDRGRRARGRQELEGRGGGCNGTELTGLSPSPLDCGGADGMGRDVARGRNNLVAVWHAQADATIPRYRTHDHASVYLPAFSLRPPPCAPSSPSALPTTAEVGPPLLHPPRPSASGSAQPLGHPPRARHPNCPIGSRKGDKRRLGCAGSWASRGNEPSEAATGAPTYHPPPTSSYRPPSSCRCGVLVRHYCLLVASSQQTDGRRHPGALSLGFWDFFRGR